MWTLLVGTVSVCSLWYVKCTSLKTDYRLCAETVPTSKVHISHALLTICKCTSLKTDHRLYTETVPTSKVHI